MKKINKILVILSIFILAILVWNSPCLFKGYGFSDFTPDQALARNLLLTGKFSIENKKNIMLTSAQISEEGEISSRGNKLNPIFGAYIYKFTGLPSQSMAIFISSIIHALALLFFALTVEKIFGKKEAVIFSLIYIFLPVIWLTVQTPLYYEFSLLFLSCALFIYFSAGAKYRYINYAFAGIFLGLAFLSRDAIALFAPAFLIWLWLNNKKAVLPVFSALTAVILIFSFTFSYFTGKNINNNQHLTFFNIEAKEAAYSDFGFYGHLYPDPYIFHYGKDEFLKDAKEISKSNEIASIDMSKKLANIGESKISIWQRIKLIFILFIKHISRFFSLEDLGGPFISLFIILGLWHLYEKRNKLWQLAVFWIGSVIFLSSVVVLAQRQHMMDFGFILVLLITLGIIKLGNISYLKESKNGAYLVLLITAVIIYQFTLSAHIVFSRSYDNSNLPILESYVNHINFSGVSKNDVIATPLNTVSIDTLNYLSNKSLIKFDNKTIKKLIGEKKIDRAFNEFKVNKILGFSPEITAQIIKQSDVKNIVSDDIKPAQFYISPIKALFMNLVK